MFKKLFFLCLLFVGTTAIGQTTTYSISGSNYSCSNFSSSAGIVLVSSQPSPNVFNFRIAKLSNGTCTNGPNGTKGTFTNDVSWTLNQVGGSTKSGRTLGGDSYSGYSSLIQMTMTSFTSGTRSYYATMTSGGSTFTTGNITIQASTAYPPISISPSAVSPSTGVLNSTNYAFGCSFSGGNGNSLTASVEFQKPNNAGTVTIPITQIGSNNFKLTKTMNDAGTYQYRYVISQSGSNTAYSAWYSMTVNAPALTIAGSQVSPSTGLLNNTNFTFGCSFGGGNGGAVTAKVVFVRPNNGGTVSIDMTQVGSNNFTLSKTMTDAGAYSYQYSVTQANGSTVTSSTFPLTITAPPLTIAANTVSPTTGLQSNTNFTFGCSFGGGNGNTPTASIEFQRPNNAGLITLLIPQIGSNNFRLSKTMTDWGIYQYRYKLEQLGSATVYSNWYSLTITAVPLVVSNVAPDAVSGLQDQTVFNFSTSIIGGNGSIIRVKAIFTAPDTKDYSYDMSDAGAGKFTLSKTLSQIGVYKVKYSATQGIITVLGTPFNITVSATSVATGDDYPSIYRQKECSVDVDAWNFYVKNCTSFLAWRLNRDAGFKTPSSSNPFKNTMTRNGKTATLHDAANWDNAMSTLGYTINKTPQVGSIAQWEAYTGGALERGHVAQVVKVNTNGTIDIEEYNFNPACGYNKRTVSASSPSNYIHFNNIEVITPLTPPVQLSPGKALLTSTTSFEVIPLGTSVSLKWSPTTGATKYGVVVASADQYGNAINPAKTIYEKYDIPASQTSITIPNALGTGNYRWRAFAYNTQNLNGLQSTDSFVFTVNTPVSNSGITLKATESNGKITLSWNVLFNRSKYKLYEGNNVIMTKSKVTATGFNESYELYRMPGAYTYKIIAECSMTNQGEECSPSILPIESNAVNISFVNNNPKGVTVITHGFQAFGDDVMPAMCTDIGNSIYAKAGGGTIYKNNPSTGQWEKIKGSGNKNEEIILEFNWSAISWQIQNGYLEAAADQLFALLMNPPKELGLTGQQLLAKQSHYIGHSRGTILLMQVFHRIKQYFPANTIDHFTMLDPHPASLMGDVTHDNIPLVSNVDGNLPGVLGKAKYCDVTCNDGTTIAIQVPENVQKVDVYYRVNGDNYESLSDNGKAAFIALIRGNVLSSIFKLSNGHIGAFNGVSLGKDWANPFNRLLDNTVINDGLGKISGISGGAHTGVHLWYTGTINYDSSIDPNWYSSKVGTFMKTENQFTTGYFYSRLGGNYSKLSNANFKLSITDLNNQLIARQGTALGSVLNGDFTNGDAAWILNGGYLNGEVKSQKLSLNYTVAPNSGYGPGSNNIAINGYIAYKGSASHSVMYISPSKMGKFLRLEITPVKGVDYFNLIFYERNTIGQVKRYSMKVSNTLTTKKVYYCPIPDVFANDGVGTLVLQLGDPAGNVANADAEILIDNITFTNDITNATLIADTPVATTQTIAISSPASGTFTAGQPITVTHASTNGTANVSLELVTCTGTTAIAIIDVNVIANGTRSYTLPSTLAAGSYRIKSYVTGTTDQGQYGTCFTVNPPVVSGLVAQYRLNGNANDESGNGNHGTITNATPTPDRFGKPNSAYLFGGMTKPSVITVKNSNTLKFTNTFSISMWIRIDDFMGMNGYGSRVALGNHCLFSKSHDRSGLYTSMSGDAQKINIGGGNTNGTTGFSFGATMQGSYVGKWIHMVQTAGNGKVQLYVNSNLVSEKTATIDFTTSNSQDLFFGKYSDMWYPLNGALDDISIYNKVLDIGEVKTLFGTASSRIGVTEDVTALVSIAPNPNEGQMTLSFSGFDEKESVDISVTNLIGSQLFIADNVVLTGSTHTIPLKIDVPSGLYFIKISRKDKEPIIKKMVIR